MVRQLTEHPAPALPATGFLVKEEAPMATASKDRAAMKEQRAQDAKLAMREYEAERLAVRAKTARLRALRLAQKAEHALTKKAG
jgi:hypothetical protein